MLVLSRKPEETIVINTPDGDITVTKLDDRRLGIEAPPEFKILRGELTVTESTSDKKAAV